MQVRYFTLDDAGSNRAAPGKTDLQLRLGRVDASGGLGEQIAVRTGGHELSYRDDQRWTERPAHFVRRDLERALFVDRGLVRAYSGFVPSLEVELVQLELLEGDNPQARVRLTAQVRDDRRALCHDSFEAQLPVQANAPRSDMERSVTALSSALHQAVEKVADRAVQCLGAQTHKAAASRRPELQPAETPELAEAR
jgi:ABC-type uncharacterized transport system auxiliary subunit